ncbi:MAG: hypothetical protein RR659_03775 [Bacilli bacterium]
MLNQIVLVGEVNDFEMSNNGYSTLSLKNKEVPLHATYTIKVLLDSNLAKELYQSKNDFPALIGIKGHIVNDQKIICDTVSLLATLQK